MMLRVSGALRRLRFNDSLPLWILRDELGDVLQRGRDDACCTVRADDESR